MVDASPMATSCPSEYSLVSGTYYRYATGAGSWGEAEASCEADGLATGAHTHLAVFAGLSVTSAELSNAYDFAKPAPGEYIWIGLTDRVTQPSLCSDGDASTFEWVTQENATAPLGNAPPWYAGDPRSPCTAQCVRILDNVARITNVDCSDPGAYLCECDAYPAVHARF